LLHNQIFSIFNPIFIISTLDKQKRSYCVLALFFLSVIFSVAQENAKTSALLAEADTFMSLNKLPEALAKTQEALDISPSSISALQKRINIFFLMNNEKESVRYVEEAIHQYPEVSEFYYLSGIINNSRGKYNKALDDFGKAIDLKPIADMYKLYLGRGVSYFNLLEYDQALSEFSSSIELNDTIASAYHSRALVNYEIHDYSAAINDFLKALDLSEDNAALYFNLGMSYYRLGDNDKACPYFHKSCTMGNTNACRMTLMECAKAIPIVP
jgi:tetratricopeptide (TPR) repeat protein